MTVSRPNVFRYPRITNSGAYKKRGVTPLFVLFDADDLLPGDVVVEAGLALGAE